MKKQMAYANALGIPYVVIVGQDEMSTGRLSVKDMQTGQQSSLTIDELIAML